MHLQLYSAACRMRSGAAAHHIQQKPGLLLVIRPSLSVCKPSVIRSPRHFYLFKFPSEHHLLRIPPSTPSPRPPPPPPPPTAPIPTRSLNLLLLLISVPRAL